MELDTIKLQSNLSDSWLGLQKYIPDQCRTTRESARTFYLWRQAEMTNALLLLSFLLLVFPWKTGY